MFRVLFHKRATKALDLLPQDDRKLILSRISALKKDPRPRGSTLLIRKENVYRIRSGNHRIIYQISESDSSIIILTIGCRGDVYKKFFKSVN